MTDQDLAEILLGARDILAAADGLGEGNASMRCSVTETAPCVEAAVSAAMCRKALLNVMRTWSFLHVPRNPVGMQAREALLATSPLRGVLVEHTEAWEVSDDLHHLFGATKAKAIAVDWLDDAARWVKDGGLST